MIGGDSCAYFRKISFPVKGKFGGNNYDFVKPFFAQKTHQERGNFSMEFPIIEGKFKKENLGSTFESNGLTQSTFLEYRF